jgi:predicted RNase H-like HicB family nuclease
LQSGRNDETQEATSIGNRHLGDVDFDVVIEQDESGAFIADVPVLPGCHTFGATKEEALVNIREAIQLYLEVRGQPATRVVAIEKVRVEG